MDKLIRIAYNKLDEETRKQLGKSSTSEIAVHNENVIAHYFENGSLIYDKKRKLTFSISGKLFLFWKELGGLDSFLRLPISGIEPEMVEGHEGHTVTFQNGSIHYIPFYSSKEELYVKFSVPVIRSDDMLSLIFEFINLKPVISAEKNAVLEPVSKSRNAYINVFFPQQSISEEAFSEPLETGQALRNPPIKSRISDLSRLSFVVPDENTIPLNLNSLLEKCEAYDLSVDPAAKPPESPHSVVVKDDFDFVKKSGITARKITRGQTINDVQVDERISKMLGRLRSDLSKKSTYDAIKINQDYKNIFDKVDKDLLAGLELIGTPHYTKIEAPYRLIISPNKYAHWKYLSNPKQDIKSISGRIALWHTQLSTRLKQNDTELAIDEGIKEYFKTIRAIDSKNNAEPFTTTLTNNDRSDIVKLTTDFKNKGKGDAYFRLEPVEASQLMLTPLGVSPDLYGKWEYCRNDNISLINWVHNATMARDHYVKVVKRGVLYPLGHQAVLTKITERKFHPLKAGNTTYLRQRQFIVVIEPEKFHRNDDSLASQKYQFAFNSTRITTLITPNLSNLLDSSLPFWPKVGEKAFLFNVIGEDLNGKTSEWSMPLIFVDDTQVKKKIEIYRNMYANAPDEYRSIKLNNQAITYAEPLDNDNTTLETKVLTFGAVVVKPPSISVVSPVHELNTPIISRPRPLSFNTDIHDIFRPSPIHNNDFSDITIVPSEENDTKECKNKLPFAPIIEKARIILPSIKYLLGNEQSKSFVYAEVYKKGGPKSQNSENEMDKFFEAENEGIDLSFSGKGDKAGGLIKPDMSIKGLTRESTGLIGGNTALQDKNYFKAEEFFGKSDSGPKLFGIFNLFEILEDFKLDEAPKFITKTLDDSKEKKIKLDWNPKLKDYPSQNNAIFEPLDEKKMEISVEMMAKSSANDKPGIEIYSKIGQFNINIIGTGDLHFLTLNFDSIEFKSTSGKKPEVDVQFNNIQFDGPLNFVNTLTEVIPFDGFSDPPNIDVTENGISAGYSLGIPAITVGAFSLQNVKLGANFTVPFINDPITVKFFFCERHEPFLLTVYVFGGGGFFTLTVTPEGFYMLEAGFEFGLCLAMDFGVAKGSVKAMGGVYFSIVKNNNAQNEVTLIGYFHISGEVDVLGLISASITLALDLIYESAGNKVTGEASITIEVEVLFFSASVQVKCKKQFAGAKGDPVFAQIMEKYNDEEGKEHDPWREYCEAFA